MKWVTNKIWLCLYEIDTGNTPGMKHLNTVKPNIVYFIFGRAFWFKSELNTFQNSYKYKIKLNKH